MKSIKFNFTTQVEDQYKDPDNKRWVSPLLLLSVNNIMDVTVTACPIWDSSAYHNIPNPTDPDTKRISITKSVGDFFTPEQVQELVDNEHFNVAIKRSRDEDTY